MASGGDLWIGDCHIPTIYTQWGLLHRPEESAPIPHFMNQNGRRTMASICELMKKEEYTPESLEQLFNEWHLYRQFYLAMTDYKKGVTEKFKGEQNLGARLHDYMKLQIGETTLRINESDRGSYCTSPISVEKYLNHS